jgi:hypothetical protein
MPNRVSLTCARCLFIAFVPSSDGWRMTDKTNGLCPACVAEDERKAAETPVTTNVNPLDDMPSS